MKATQEKDRQTDMAKGLRASSRKKNNAALRERVFGPAFDARTARLSAKLQELAAQPPPEQEKAMDIDEDVEKQDAEKSTEADEEGRAIAKDQSPMLTTLQRWMSMHTSRQISPARSPQDRGLAE